MTQKAHLAWCNGRDCDANTVAECAQREIRERETLPATMPWGPAYWPNQNLSEEEEAELAERAKWDAYYEGLREC